MPPRTGLLLIPLFLGIALSGCTEPSIARAPEDSDLPTRAEHHSYDWHMMHGLNVGGSGGNSGYIERGMWIPIGTTTLTAYANWTCPVSAACEAGLSVRNGDSDAGQNTVSGSSPLKVEIQDPLQGQWTLTVSRSDAPVAFTYEARGTLEIVVCCFEAPETEGRQGRASLS